MKQPFTTGDPFPVQQKLTHATCRSYKCRLGQVDTNCRALHGDAPSGSVVDDASTLAHGFRRGWGRLSHCSRTTLAPCDNILGGLEPIRC
jgi:hypothetical protein